MTQHPPLPDAWTLTASAFNWTPEVIRAERSAPDIAVGIVADDVAPVIEVELGQLWRSFPTPTDEEADEFASALVTAGGAVSIVGVSLDDWATPTRRRDDDERLAFLLPQLRTSHRIGAAGVRLPIGQAGRPLLERLRPHLHELDLTLYEEIQGQQTPQNPVTAAAIESLAAIDDPRVRLLVDVSMLMPALPDSYLDALATGGVSSDLLARLRTAWLESDTMDAVVGMLRSGGVPRRVQTMYMNLLVRFGRSRAEDLRGVVPLTGAFHLKFWDLDDTADRVSQPLRDLGALLASTGFRGTLTSEWGGHEWLDDEDASDITRRHLSLARAALADGAAAST
ncbi:sugar phosphate isomerase/epimerase [Microbacterium rhizomatis]|uniref:sugar phosphate isomerase/epimerase n=1 Tax=Microbacterium rhizomatis TaxID=1631477 RepID=UPI001FE60D1E|nr:sugar phosphate isomerase/epimerase [Microbacterium rhizomatis]